VIIDQYVKVSAFQALDIAGPRSLQCYFDRLRFSPSVSMVAKGFLGDRKN
jgi:hypothetical protein